jgi:hypothetical protein
MNTYTWNIIELYCSSESIDGNQNVVNNVHYTVTATDDSTPPNVSTVYKLQNIIYDPNDPFIEYVNLKPEIIVSWVQEEIGSDGVSAIQSELDKLIADLVNPPTVLTPIPWEQNS